jgi:thiamine biosynthesis lipoprotein
VRHPRRHEELIAALRIDDAAVCTSGNYERRSAERHHIIDPADGRSADRVMSVTAIAPTAVVADALSTAAFVLGPHGGIELLTDQGIEGMIVTSDMELLTTPKFEGFASR